MRYWALAVAGASTLGLLISEFGQSHMFSKFIPYSFLPPLRQELCSGPNYLYRPINFQRHCLRLFSLQNLCSSPFFGSTLQSPITLGRHFVPRC